MPDKVNGNNYSGKSNIVSLNSSHTPIQPKSELQLNERDQKLATLQKMADNSPYSQRFAHFTSMANNSIPQQPVSQLSKDSNGLPDNLKQGVESLSGISMDDVKVHYNSDKPAQLNAHAYAQGTDIHIASGQEKHLPHEAWHVVQQKQGRVQPTTMMKAKVFINDDKGLEKEADVMGARALQMKPFSLSDYKTEKSVQRKEIIQRTVGATIIETVNTVKGFYDDHIDPIKECLNGIKESAEQGQAIETKKSLGYDDIALTFTKFAGPIENLGDIVTGYMGTDWLPPGIGDGIAAFESGIKAYQTNEKRILLNNYLAITETYSETEIKTINNYISEINKELASLSFDAFMLAVSSIGTFIPVGGTIATAAAKAVGMLKKGILTYLEYKAKQEWKRAERIGNSDIKKVKEDNLEEKSSEMDESGNNLFEKALKSYRERELFKNHPQKGKDTKMDNNIQRIFKNKEKEFIINLQALNAKRIDKNADEVTEKNLEDFLTMEKATIEHIRDEVLAEKNILEWLAYQFSSKKGILNDLIKGSNFNFTNITIEELDKLSPENETYFFNKTREAIHAASNRKHFLANERLGNLKDMLLKKKDDRDTFTYLTGLHPEAYKPDDTDDIKFNNSVDKFIESAKI
jgi:hypothetical protein